MWGYRRRSPTYGGIRPRIHIIADSQALYTQYLQRIAQQKTGLSYGYVWGTRVWVQRCLNTVMSEALSGLDPEEAMKFRHHLQQAWQECDASKARTNLKQIAEALTKVNRSSGSVLGHALESTLTVQHTGCLLHSDRGLHVLNSLQTLLTREGTSRRAGTRARNAPVCHTAGSGAPAPPWGM